MFASSFDFAPSFWNFLALSIWLYLSHAALMRLQGTKVPVVGALSVLEPRILVNYRFFKDAAKVVNEGYENYKGKAYRFMRNDADMIVLPVSYIDELNTLPPSVANPTRAHVHNLFGGYTGVDLLLHNDLHYRTIQKKLTPNLGAVTKPMEEELVRTLEHDFPDCDENWVAFKPYHVLLLLVARMSARVFVGLPFCRNPKWLEISTRFTENIFLSVVTMRLIPTWLHPVLGLLLPSLWRGRRYIKQAKDFLAPEFKQRLRALENGTDIKATEGEESVLTWMAESAEGSEKDPRQLAHLEVVLALASIHTSQMNAVHVLHDAAAHPEYFEELRNEIREVYQEDGGWEKSSYSKLHKLDSFLRESQRFSPPSILSYHRIMMEKHVLSDGTVLPKGAHICMATKAIQNDPEVTPHPEVFDPLRSYKMRQRPGETYLHQFATTERHILNFGHGKAACPGRFFASLEIKVLFVKLIMEYDFKMISGLGRPANLTAHEFIFPDTEAQLMVKRRKTRGEAPF